MDGCKDKDKKLSKHYLPKETIWTTFLAFSKFHDFWDSFIASPSFWRSHPDILVVPSRLFYENELIPCGAETKINKFLSSTLLPTKGLHPTSSQFFFYWKVKSLLLSQLMI